MLIALLITERGSVFGANLLAQKYSPTQRKCCVRGYRLAGAQSDPSLTGTDWNKYYKNNKIELEQDVYQKQGIEYSAEELRDGGY